MTIFFSVREIVEMAISTETSGKAFYETATKLARKKSLKEFFQYLAEEEEKHRETFQDFYDTLKERPEIVPYDWEEAKLYLTALVDSRFFTGPDTAIKLAQEAKNEMEAINLATNFEKETLLFFYQMMEVVKPQDHELVKKVIEEEKKHIRRLSTMRKELAKS